MSNTWAKTHCLCTVHPSLLVAAFARTQELPKPLTILIFYIAQAGCFMDNYISQPLLSEITVRVFSSESPPPSRKTGTNFISIVLDEKDARYLRSFLDSLKVLLTTSWQCLFPARFHVESLRLMARGRALTPQTWALLQVLNLAGFPPKAARTPRSRYRSGFQDLKYPPTESLTAWVITEWKRWPKHMLRTYWSLLRGNGRLGKMDRTTYMPL